MRLRPARAPSSLWDAINSWSASSARMPRVPSPASCSRRHCHRDCPRRRPTSAYVPSQDLAASKARAACATRSHPLAQQRSMPAVRAHQHRRHQHRPLRLRRPHHLHRHLRRPSRRWSTPLERRPTRIHLQMAQYSFRQEPRTRCRWRFCVMTWQAAMTRRDRPPITSSSMSQPSMSAPRTSDGVPQTAGTMTALSTHARPTTRSRPRQARSR